MPIVSSRDVTEEEAECPVCLEPLSFSFRLPGEKPHIVPECGHALHEACFSAVYGPPPGSSRVGVIRKTNLGVCGVCRRPMKVGDGDGGKSNKLAALTGMGDPNGGTFYPGRETSSSMRAFPRSQSALQRPFDPNEDDPIDHTGSIKSHDGQGSSYVVAPSIQVRSEFPTITRTTDPSQPLTCIVTIELPGKRPPGSVPVPRVIETFPVVKPTMLDSRTPSTLGSPRLDSPPQYATANSTQRSRSTQGFSPAYTTSSLQEQTQNFAESYRDDQTTHSEESPFHAITEDLRARIIDWKGHPISGLGPLQMYDLLSVRRDAIVREFFVYLFKEAIICVVEEKKRGLGRLLSNAGVGDNGSLNGGNAGQQKGVLRLKGRIYIRHIKHVTDTSVAGEMSLTIDMEDERLDSFILIFRERSSLETWKNHIQRLVTAFQQQNGFVTPKQPSPRDTTVLEEFGGSNKATRMLSGSTGTTSSSNEDSLLSGPSSRSTTSSASHGSIGGLDRTLKVHHSQQHRLATLEEDDEPSRYSTPIPVPLVTPRLSGGPSNSLAPLGHPPLDLILVISIPPPHITASAANLKHRVIKTSLDFVIASLSPRDRLSLVTFEVGVGGKVRKTPFLNVGKSTSRTRLSKFVNEIGASLESDNDEFLVRGSQDEKTDVVTAVNHGLDVVLQRKAKNPISGMILISDTADTTRRAQMDLVLARAEAASIPIHAFGYGRSHDPASLWLISNHTSGTYTFVKDWYDLQGCIAGCVGGMMSIALRDMKLHLKIVDGQQFKIRKLSGGPTSILHSDGRDVDVELGELRYGERKEMLIELELDNTDVIAEVTGHVGNRRRTLNATDQFNQRMGLDALLNGDSPDLVDGMMDKMIDEVPVFEVDGSFYDPSAGRHVTRLAHPVLLTVTLMPPHPSKIRSPVPPGSDPDIVRRRMELLTSDMITRALVLVSRKNHQQAQKILVETRRILHTVVQNIGSALPGGGSVNAPAMVGRNRKEILQLTAMKALQAMMADMQLLSESLEDNPEVFAHDQRNFGAQQAMVLRDQKSWSNRSAIERLFWTVDNSIELAMRSTGWVGRD
ncbi:hypothetical protein BDM02DRAFT_3095631 [Thelephora ganbajun]|uniref:Uncharacterized protein n=1 Tax=Thelephora ganbajun TaxID=370292 RepID=A0ACB6ZI74_THEGA|nr:hypothetical protein BDM02DRAFT_3095631 [Thelephora ganbajun]